jgi:hypothetical protein
MTAQRIYTVGTPDGKVRLVKATSRAQALSHVANSVFVIRVANQDDLVYNLSKGVMVEYVSDGEQLELIA